MKLLVRELCPFPVTAGLCESGILGYSTHMVFIVIDYDFRAWRSGRIEFTLPIW